MKKLTGFALLGVLLFGCGSNHSSQAYQAPDFELKDIQGKTVSLKSLQGHPVMLDFWATWCGPCQMSIPLVQQFYMKHKEDGLVVLGVNMDDDPAPVIPFVEHFHMTYLVLYGGASSVSSEYRVQGIPTFIFIDAKGQIHHRFEGFSREMPRAWEEEFQALLPSR